MNLYGMPAQMEFGIFFGITYGICLAFRIHLAWKPVGLDKVFRTTFGLLAVEGIASMRIFQSCSMQVGVVMLTVMVLVESLVYIRNSKFKKTAKVEATIL